MSEYAEGGYVDGPSVRITCNISEYLIPMRNVAEAVRAFRESLEEEDVY